MTVLGKILVFLHLILSLVAAFLFAMAYAAHANYKKAYDDLNKEYVAASASATAFRDEANEARRVSQDAVRVRDEVVKSRDAEIKVQKDAADQYQRDLLAAKQTIADNARIIDSKTTQLQLVNQDNKKLEAAIIAKDTEIKGLLATANDLKKLKVEADIERDAYKEMSAKLEKQVGDLTDVIAKAKKAGGVIQVTGAGPAETPPPEDLKGIVKRDADQTGLVLISVGSDAGLLKGHMLEVYRLTPQIKYLGKIKIIEVRPYEAVGQIVGKPSGAVLKGDTVATKIF
jgi:hypothetical protein